MLQKAFISIYTTESNTYSSMYNFGALQTTLFCPFLIIFFKWCRKNNRRQQVSNIFLCADDTDMKTISSPNSYKADRKNS